MTQNVERDRAVLGRTVACSAQQGRDNLGRRTGAIFEGNHCAETGDNRKIAAAMIRTIPENDKPDFQASYPIAIVQNPKTKNTAKPMKKERQFFFVNFGSTS
jgi:hypothetical protein